MLENTCVSEEELDEAMQRVLLRIRQQRVLKIIIAQNLQIFSELQSKRLISIKLMKTDQASSPEELPG